MKRMHETINENSQDQDNNGELEPRRSKIARTGKYFGPYFLAYVLEGEPRTFKEVVNYSHVERGH